MFDKKTMTITFPHVIPSNKLNNKDYTWNDVDGGIKKIADFGLVRNQFFGGQVTIMGLISNLGIWACKHYETNRIVGFYVDDPNRVTEFGRKVLTNRFTDCDVVFEKTDTTPQGITPEERKRRQELQTELIKYGVEPQMITHTTADGLEGLLKAVMSGKAEKPLAVVDNTPVTVYEETVSSPQPTRQVGRRKTMEV